MLDEFLGGGGGGKIRPSRQVHGGRPERNRNFVSARRDILITNVEGRDGTKLPVAHEIGGTAAARGRKRVGSRRKQGVISAYLRYE